jgi:glutathione synthase/RimK-type ligase-like ATP-grasp enzyme
MSDAATAAFSKLNWEPKAANMSNRTVKALVRAGIDTWPALVTEANRTPNCIRGIEGLGPKGVSEILTALSAAGVTHTIRTRGRR